MNRFIIELSKDGFYKCTDTLNGVSCEFEGQKFNETQKFEFTEGAPVNANVLASIAQSMGEWLHTNHYLKIAPMLPIRVWMGVRIKQLRTEQGLTQKELAERAGVEPITIMRIEGAKFAARIDTLAQIAGALGCDIDFIKR